MNAVDLSFYDKTFFDSLARVSAAAAQKVMRRIHELHAYRSVVDFGCGSGTWLEAADAAIKAAGAAKDRLLGVDGEHARERVDARRADYVFQDLEERIVLDRRFDLAICLEVAEHLTPSRAATFVQDVCAASDVVLFGAAIPMQEGQNHINEQWPAYWARLFVDNGYGCHDVLRDAFWCDPLFEKCPYYAANALLYVRDGHPLSAKLASRKVLEEWRLNVVHPALFTEKHYRTVGVRATVATLGSKLLRLVRRLRRERAALGSRAPPA
jgi:SAM-dependent methyltransferase